MPIEKADGKPHEIPINILPHLRADSLRQFQHNDGQKIRDSRREYIKKHHQEKIKTDITGILTGNRTDGGCRKRSARDGEDTGDNGQKNGGEKFPLVMRQIPPESAIDIADVMPAQKVASSRAAFRRKDRRIFHCLTSPAFRRSHGIPRVSPSVLRASRSP